MNRSASVGFVVLVVLTLVAGVSAPITVADTGPITPPAAATQPSTIATPPDGGQFAVQETQNFDKTTFEITVHENGSATWTFRHEQVFANEDNETAAEENFKAFAEEFEANETDLYDQFVNQSRLMVESGQRETGREMEATNFRRSAQIEEPFTRGVVEMSFTWEGFAAAEADRIVVGDVFEDVFLQSADQTIVIEASGDLTFQSIEPSDGQYAGDSLEDAESVQWSGQRQFIDGRPRVVFDRSGSTDTGLITAMGSGPGWYLLAALFGLGLAAAAVIWYRRYGPGADEPAAGETPAESTQPAPATVDTAGESVEDTDTVTDEELLTDEDRVVKLIRENGGRMKQVNIVEETGWSKSKVSMLLSDMEDDGIISKLRVGRENIISLEGFEPEATKSPFEE